VLKYDRALEGIFTKAFFDELIFVIEHNKRCAFENLVSFFFGFALIVLLCPITKSELKLKTSCFDGLMVSLQR
jgi:hypothetical protein